MNHTDLVFDAAPPTFGSYEKRPMVLIPQGSEQAVCYGFALLGNYPAIDFATRQPKLKANGEPMYDRKMRVFFEFPDTLVDTYGEDGQPTGEKRPATLSHPVNMTMGENSNLRAMLEGMRGAPYTKEQAQKWTPQNAVPMIGHNCIIAIEHKPKKDGDGVSMKMNTFSTLPKKMGKEEMFHEPLIFSIEDRDPVRMKKAFDRLPKWMREDCMKAKEWALVAHILAPAPPEPAAAPQAQVVGLPKSQIAAADAHLAKSIASGQQAKSTPVAAPAVVDEDLPF